MQVNILFIIKFRLTIAIRRHEDFSCIDVNLVIFKTGILKNLSVFVSLLSILIAVPARYRL